MSGGAEGATDGVGDRAASGLRRFALLLGLRRRLLFRGPGRGPLAKVLFFFLLAQVLAFATLAGYGVYQLAKAAPEYADNLTRVLFLGVFAFQLALGVMGVAIGEFFDTSRLQHLPVGPGEIFGAMAASAALSPTTLFVAAPIVGVLAAAGGAPATIAAQGLVFLAALYAAHAASLALGFLFLRVFSRRRLRDFATVFGSLLGVGIYVGFRAAADPGATTDLREYLGSDRWAQLSPLPSQWFAEAFVALGRGGAAPNAYLAGGAAFLGAVWFVGARAFRATYDQGGETGHAGETVKDVRLGVARLLPRDVGAVAQLTYAVFRREPQLRALLIQQLVFFAVPIVFSAGARSRDREGAFPFLVAMMIVLSHSAVALSLFGLDGRGLASLFASPVSRVRLLFGRIVAVGSVFAASDLLAAVAITAAVRGMRGNFDGAPAEAATLYGLVLTGDAALLAVGAVTSVLAPMPVVRMRRGANPRLGREGCLVVVGRMFALIPVAALAALAAGVATLPKWLGLPPIWYLASGGAGAVLVAGFVAAGCALGGHLLTSREGAILDALADTGE